MLNPFHTLFYLILIENVPGGLAEDGISEYKVSEQFTLEFPYSLGVVVFISSFSLSHLQINCL